MAVHDWRRVEASTFHDFHARWITHLTESLNGGLLPSPYYAQSEQHVGRKIADVLTLHTIDPDIVRTPPRPPEGGAVAVADAPPKVARKQVLDPSAKRRRRTLTVRHTTGHRIIALVEIASPGNKDSVGDVAEFVRKIDEALRARIHVVLIDLLAPGKHDPSGLHGALVELMEGGDYDLPAGRPLTLASYAAGGTVEVYLEHLAVGDALPSMPLFLTPDDYIPLPLDSTYEVAYRGVPAFWREVIEGRSASQEHNP